MTVTAEQLEANKKLARDYIDQVFNQHNPAKAADFVTGDVVWPGGGRGDIAGAENLAGLLESFIGALPDLHAAEQDVIAENDLVLVRLVVTATVKGNLLGVPADGKPGRRTARRSQPERSRDVHIPSGASGDWPITVTVAPLLSRGMT
jgi:predicted ester cyclase